MRLGRPKLIADVIQLSNTGQVCTPNNHYATHRVRVSSTLSVIYRIVVVVIGKAFSRPRHAQVDFDPTLIDSTVLQQPAVVIDYSVLMISTFAGCLSRPNVILRPLFLISSLQSVSLSRHKPFL